MLTTSPISGRFDGTCDVQIRPSFIIGIASSTGNFPCSLPSTDSSTLPSSNASRTMSQSTTTSSSMYSTGLFPVTTSKTKTPNPYTSHFSFIFTVRQANSGAM
ncbi:hypothetical protein GQ457_09G014630 [Hibiscus cannabinus]